MVGKFENPLILRKGKAKLEVCGPIQWNMPADQGLSVKVEVRITQDNHTRYGDSGADRFSPPDDEWMIYMNPGPLKEGQALGHGRALDQDGNVVNEWDTLLVLEAEVTTKAVKQIVATALETGQVEPDGEAPPADEWPELLRRPWEPDA